MDEQKEQIEIKCNYCKVKLPLYKFSKNRADKYFKSCDECRVKQKKTREKNKCPHGNPRNTCKECREKYKCVHGRQCKSRCSECLGYPVNKGKCSRCKKNYEPDKDGLQTCIDCRYYSDCLHGSRIKGDCILCLYCIHNRRRNHCKDCMNDEQKIEFIIKRMISHSRENDKKKNRYDADRFIDRCFLEALIEDNDSCYYCKTQFTYNECIKSFVTIERLDNNIGHIKSNCVLACWGCNNSHNNKDDIRV